MKMPRLRFLTAGGAAFLATAFWLTSFAFASHIYQARDARTLTIKDEGNLHFVKSSGSTLIDEGRATGSLPATVRIHFVYDGNPSVSSHIYIYSSHGTILLSANGRLSSPTNPNPSFSGTFTVTGGSSRYSRAHGAGKLYGVYHRRSYAMLVQTEGTLHY
jgi:hypothetical protein